mmetsp:Transcript_93780/g.180960  ORF Transcript_93780/g.180960 Transcript_93780/m.180960 type:complete len:572 (-) Transcript_93780:164-1879(-)
MAGACGNSSGMSSSSSRSSGSGPLRLLRRLSMACLASHILFVWQPNRGSQPYPRSGLCVAVGAHRPTRGCPAVAATIVFLQPMGSAGNNPGSRSACSWLSRKRLTRRGATSRKCTITAGQQLASEDEPEDPAEAETEDAPEGEDIADEVLGAEMAAFADAVMPRASHRNIKKRLLTRVEALAQQILDPLAKCYVFGSSANGCGEASSDMDLAIYISPDENADTMPASEALNRLADAATGAGFLVLETRFQASVPIVVLEMLDSKDVATGYTCDVSFQHLLPLHNTRLIRTYIELAPQLAALTAVVKRWAKAAGIAGTWEHFISTYSWTLMVLYYCQVQLGLPSLHAMARQQKRNGAPPPDERAHDADFMSLQAARNKYCPEEVTVAGLGGMLRGFFEFYSDEFDWGNEVVSVRLGERRYLEDDDGNFSPLFNTQLRQVKRYRQGGKRVRVTRGFQYLNIEDPIELHRNLNFALKPASFRRIEAEMMRALDLVEAGAGLRDLLNLHELPVAQPRRSSKPAKHPWLAGFLPLGRKPPCECGQCGATFKDFSSMLSHERDCSPLSRLLFRTLQL